MQAFGVAFSRNELLLKHSKHPLIADEPGMATFIACMCGSHHHKHASCQLSKAYWLQSLQHTDIKVHLPNGRCEFQRPAQHAIAVPRQKTACMA